MGTTFYSLPLLGRKKVEPKPATQKKKKRQHQAATPKTSVRPASRRRRSASSFLGEQLP